MSHFESVCARVSSGFLNDYVIVFTESFWGDAFLSSEVLKYFPFRFGLLECEARSRNVFFESGVFRLGRVPI